MPKNWDRGNILEIDLGENRIAYGMVIEFPLMSFFDLLTSKGHEKEIDEIVASPVAFKVWVMKYAIGKNGWNRIGRKELSAEQFESPWFYKYDMIGKKFSQVRGDKEQPASKEECLELECAAVWDPEHIISRLNDHFDGRPNKWVESLSAKNKGANQSR